MTRAAVFVMLLGAVTGAQGRSGRAGTATPRQWALEIADFAALPITGLADGTGNNAGSLARINVMRQEPGPAGRFFVNDLTGPLYILDRQTGSAARYLDFNGRGAHTGLFDRLTTEAGLASGFISFEFDPDYARNGRFYTIHLEELALPGSQMPDAASAPDLVDGYVPTPPVPTPGPVDHEGVLIEWTDTSIANSTFEGRARELLRIPLNSRIHPLADITFNPAARQGDPDWRVMYIACGDGGSGDDPRPSTHFNPQRLDTLVGKILRIVPDLTSHTDTSRVSENQRYRVPLDNPFVAVEGARPEIWAYGLRNPHRVSWNLDRGRADLIASMIGWRTWETVLIVHKGGNYGYPLREGGELVDGGRMIRELPQPDVIPVRVNDTITKGSIAPLYPVVRYGHGGAGGDAIAGGFVYRGRRIRQLSGKFVFGDISTGRLWYADYTEMRAADDGVARTMAEAHELQVWWNDPADSPDRGRQLYPTLAPVVTAAYHARGGKDPDLPGTAAVAGTGRVDLRLAIDRDGELYLLSKSDGVIRAVTGMRSVPPAGSTRK